jgi:hypothetical protein
VVATGTRRRTHPRYPPCRFAIDDIDAAVAGLQARGAEIEDGRVLDPSYGADIAVVSKLLGHAACGHG